MRLDHPAPRPLTQIEMATEQQDSTTGHLYVDGIDQGGELLDRVHVGQTRHGRLGCDCHSRETR